MAGGYHMTTVKIKICGLTRLQQAIEIAMLGVDAIGFVLYPPSPRYVDIKTVRSIVDQLPPLVKTVGVFVNELPETVTKIVRQCRLDLAQLSGDETPSECIDLDRRGIRWIKALRIDHTFSPALLDDYPAHCFLFDARSSQSFGGTGQTFDWHLLNQIRDSHRIILAGGINDTNVDAAIRRLRPYAIDVSSGVELAPGIKSIDRIHQLIASVDRASRALTGESFDSVDVFYPNRLPSSKTGR
jgi:phosphoribosylanthranilate isomerase